MVGERKLIGPLTERQQLYVDEISARAELKSFIPEKCRDCWGHLELTVLGRIATKVAKGEVSIGEGIKEVTNYTADCSGTRPDTLQFDAPVICPKENAEKRAGKTDCW